MKVALVSFDFGEYCVRQANPLAQMATFGLWLPRVHAGPHMAILNRAVNLHAFDKPRLREPLKQLRLVKALLHSINNFHPDVIHLQQGHLWFNLALPFLRRYPLVLTVHDARRHLGDRESQRTPQAFMTFGFHRAAHLIVHSAQIKKVLVDDHRLRDGRIHVIPIVALGDDQARSEVQEEDGLVLFFGRIWEYKGLEYLIRAEPLISAQVPNARFVIAGQGEDLARYRRLMIHPERFIVRNTYISDDERDAWFRKASVVVLPYTEASQTGVIPVAYTFSKPVIATTVGGLPEMVDHGRTGYLVQPRDENVLADAVVQLLRDKERRRQFGMNGRRKLQAEHSPEIVAKQTLAVYQLAADHLRTQTVRRRPGHFVQSEAPQD